MSQKSGISVAMCTVRFLLVRGRLLAPAVQLQRASSSPRTMKLITPKQNRQGLKIVLAARLTGASVDVEFADGGDRAVLIVSDSVRLFSANAAVWYLHAAKAQSGGKVTKSCESDSWLEWEANALTASINEPLTHLEAKLKGDKKFINGVRFNQMSLLCNHFLTPIIFTGQSFSS